MTLNDLDGLAEDLQEGLRAAWPEEATLQTQHTLDCIAVADALKGVYARIYNMAFDRVRFLRRTGLAE